MDIYSDQVGYSQYNTDSKEQTPTDTLTSNKNINCKRPTNNIEKYSTNNSICH